MPKLSTVTNIRHVFLNTQVPVDVTNNRVLLSLDAAKAFDSLKWENIWALFVEHNRGVRSQLGHIHIYALTYAPTGPAR